MEVTISLSKSGDDKSNESNRKVISLKDLSDFHKHKPTTYKDQIETDQYDIESEITNRKQEIASLQSKKEILLQDIKTAIHKEKEAWLVTKEEEREEARNIGYKTGYDAGLEHVEKEYEQVISEANRMTELAKADYFKTIAKHEKAIIQLAMSAAEKITKNHLVATDYGITEILKHGLQDLKDKSDISTYVHPSDYEYVMKRKEELEELLEEGQLLSIYADDQMNTGDCLIKHPFGQVEIGIDVQLQQIKAALEENISENE